jgi:hypothetical protein
LRAFYDTRLSSLHGAISLDVDTGADYWISGPKRDGGDALYGGGGV